MADDYIIISRDSIRRKGAAAFAHRRTRDSHGFNPGSFAIAEFQAGFDQAAKDHATLMFGKRVELAQGSEP